MLPLRRSCVKLGLTLLAALLAALPAQAQWAVFSIRSLDQAIGDVRYLLRQAAREDLIAPLDGLVSTYLGKGVDGKRPLGVYLAGMGDAPAAVLFVPVTGQADFQALLKAVGLDVVESEKGLPSVALPNAKNLFLRFENQYVYAAEREAALQQGKLPDPVQLLSASARNNLIAFALRIDEIPSEARQQFLSTLDEGVRRDSAPRAHESAAEHRSRVFGMKLVADLGRRFMVEGKELALGLNIDQVRHTLSAEAALAGRPGSKLAEQIRAFGAARSAFAALTADSAMHLLFAAPIAPELRQELDALIDQVVAEALHQEASPQKRALTEKVYQTLAPTLRGTVLDLALVLHGPAEGENFGLVAALKIKEGRKIEALIRDMVQQTPESERRKSQITLDRARAAGLSIHSFVVAEPDETMQKRFGSQEVFFALREDAALLALGTRGPALLTQVLKTLETPGAAPGAPPIQAAIALRKLAPLLEDGNPRIAKAMKEAFTASDQDRIRLTLQGGETLNLRLEAGAQIIKFAAALAEPVGQGRP